MLSYEGFQIEGGQRLLLTFTEENGTESTLLWHVPEGYEGPDGAEDFDASEDGLLIGGAGGFFPDSIREVQQTPGANTTALTKVPNAAELQDGDQLLFVDEPGPGYDIEWEVRLTFSEEMWEDEEHDHFASSVPLIEEASYDEFYVVAKAQ